MCLYLNFFVLTRLVRNSHYEFLDFGVCCQKRQAEQNRGKVDIDTDIDSAIDASIGLLSGAELHLTQFIMLFHVSFCSCTNNKIVARNGARRLLAKPAVM